MLTERLSIVGAGHPLQTTTVIVSSSQSVADVLRGIDAEDGDLFLAGIMVHRDESAVAVARRVGAVRLCKAGSICNGGVFASGVRDTFLNAYAGAVVQGLRRKYNSKRVISEADLKLEGFSTFAREWINER